MQTHIKTLVGENGELYTVTDGRRILTAKCSPHIDIYEHSQRINLLGSRSYNVKSHFSAVLTCRNSEATREISIEFLRKVSSFEFVGDFQRENGIYERVRLDNIVPNELDLNGDWEFDVFGQEDTIIRLQNL